MVEHDPPVQSVEKIVEDFRSINPNGKSELGYQEIFRKSVGCVGARVVSHHLWTRFAHMTSARVEQAELKNEVPQCLAKLTLPELKHFLAQLSTTMDPSNAGNCMHSWYQVILQILIPIDDLLDELNHVMSTIYQNPKPGESFFGDDYNLELKHFTFYGARSTRCKVQDLLEGPFSRVLLQCDKFFDGFSFSNPSTDRSSLSSRWETIAELIATSIDEIDYIINWLGKPLLDLAKEELQVLVWQIEDQLRSLLKQMDPIYHKFEKGHESGSDWELLPLNPTGMKFVRVSIPVIKLARVFFNKLSRATNSYPLIFAGSSMDMSVDVLKRLLRHTKETESYIHEFVNEVKASPSNRREVIEVTVNLIGGFVESTHVLESYWDSLLASNDPQVDREAIGDARQWLKSWSSPFFVATGNVMGATGCSYPWPQPGDEQDTEPATSSDDGIFDDDDVEDGYNDDDDDDEEEDDDGDDDDGENDDNSGVNGDDEYENEKPADNAEELPAQWQEELMKRKAFLRSCL